LELRTENFELRTAKLELLGAALEDVVPTGR
jgi:hypothetical protein